MTAEAALPDADVVVQLLTSADLAVLGRVAPGVFDHEIRPDLAARFFANPANLLAVAVADGVVVGMASGIAYVHPDKEPQLFVNEVGVAEPFRRRGVARRLVTALIARGREAGCVEAWVATEAGNAPARALYASLGGDEDDDLAVVYTWRTDRGGAAPRM